MVLSRQPSRERCHGHCRRTGYEPNHQPSGSAVMVCSAIQCSGHMCLLLLPHLGLSSEKVVTRFHSHQTNVPQDLRLPWLPHVHRRHITRHYTLLHMLQSFTHNYICYTYYMTLHILHHITPYYTHYIIYIHYIKLHALHALHMITYLDNLPTAFA